MTYRRILCPIGSEAESQVALSLAIKLARESRGSIYLMHVLPPATAMMYPTQSLMVTDRARAAARLETLATRLPVGIGRKLIVSFGYTATEITNAARNLQADLIVMGTHGRSGLARALMGSITAKVVRAAPCPVLALPLTPAAEETGAQAA